MDSAVHFILLFSGLWSLAFSASRQFYIQDTGTTNWDEAQKQCREKYTDLATIENQEEMDAVKNLLNGTQKKFWIGLKQNQTSDKSSWFWSDGASYDYSNWNYERTPLIVIKEEKTWREALRFCRQNHVELVSVQSEEMQDLVGVVTRNAFTNVTSRVWIGLRHTCDLGFWYWVTGETICYQNWAPGNGTGVEDCGDVERSGAMLSDIMGSALNFIQFFSERTPLIVIKEEKTWREALRFCRQNHVDLVFVQSEEMQDWLGVVTQNAFSNVTSRVWIGLRHTCALGFWYWVTGETICYQNWAP
ncbi:macrophage mannose receptor 1-like, partial [Clarias magur]